MFNPLSHVKYDQDIYHRHAVERNQTPLHYTDFCLVHIEGTIEKAIEEIQSKSCLKFVSMSSSSKQWIKFVKKTGLVSTFSDTISFRYHFA